MNGTVTVYVCVVGLVALAAAIASGEVVKFHEPCRLAPVKFAAGTATAAPTVPALLGT